LKTGNPFVDTVVFSTIVSRKLIAEENFERIKDDVRNYIYKFFPTKYTYIIIDKENLKSGCNNL
jgi:hypothetical protein